MIIQRFKLIRNIYKIQFYIFSSEMKWLRKPLNMPRNITSPIKYSIFFLVVLICTRNHSTSAYYNPFVFLTFSNFHQLHALVWDRNRKSQAHNTHKVRVHNIFYLIGLKKNKIVSTSASIILTFKKKQWFISLSHNFKSEFSIQHFINHVNHKICTIICINGKIK